LSLPSLRVSGDYLLIASIGFQLGFVEVIKNIEFAGAASGLTGLPPLFTGSLPQPGLRRYHPGARALVVWLVHPHDARRLRASHPGHARRRGVLLLARAQRDGDQVTIFAVGSGSRARGALYAHYFQFLSPEQFGIVQSALILTMVVVGGMGPPRSRWWAPAAHRAAAGHHLRQPAAFRHGAAAGHALYRAVLCF
jgi:branched-chain amino acid transport system permease protein